MKSWFRKLLGFFLPTTMKILESNPSGPLSAEALLEFEAKIGHQLPEDYRQFLLEHNGALLEATAFKVGEGDWDAIDDHFFGLHEGPTQNFKDSYFDDADYFPRNCLPIAADGMGNYICIGLAGTHRGKILFLDHETRDDDSPDQERQVIASSFTAFVKELRTEEEVMAEEEARTSSSNEPPILKVLLLMCKAGGTKPSETLPGQVEGGCIFKLGTDGIKVIPEERCLHFLDLFASVDFQTIASGPVPQPSRGPTFSIHFYFRGGKEGSFYLSSPGFVSEGNTHVRWGIDEATWNELFHLASSEIDSAN